MHCPWGRGYSTKFSTERLRPECQPLTLDILQNSKNKPRGLHFSKALFEGLIFGGAYIGKGLCTEGNLRYKISWASL